MRITRKRAFLIHLALSILIFSTLIATLYFFWFPGDLFFADGGWQGLKLVAMVDLVLGPALTLILFSPGKKGLKFDLAAIALVQVSALVYGFYTTYQQQTVALVFADGGFNTVSLAGHEAANKKLIELGETPTDVRDYGQNKPVAIYTRPLDGATFGKFFADSMNGYPDPFERSDKYLKLTEYHKDLQKALIDEDTLKSEQAWASVQKTLSATGRDPDSVEIYRFKGRYGKGFAVFSPEKMMVVDYVVQKSKKASETVQATSAQ